jgi:hypothetical protein
MIGNDHVRFGRGPSGKGPAQSWHLARRPTSRKLRGKDLLAKPGRSHRYHVLPPAARTITALLALRDQVISPLLAGIRSPRMGRKPTHWTRVDRDYETLRVNMHTLFHDLGITTTGAAAA